MTILQYFTVSFFLAITSVRTSTVPYEDIELAFPDIPKLIYTDESNPTFSGYSYATKDFNGGGSNVVFTTGANSANRLRDEMSSMNMPEKYPPKDMSVGTRGNLVPKSEEVELNKNKQDFNSNVEAEERKPSRNSVADNNFVEYQAPLRQISLDVPYSAFGENLLNFDLPAVLPRYQIPPSVIQNQQYYPHNPYARLELPLDNFDFYNPAVPLFYQAAVSIPDNSFGHVPIIAEDVKTSTEPHITNSLQTNATVSKSNVEESIFNRKSMTNAILKTFSKSDINEKFESMTTTEKDRGEVMSSESTNPPVTSESSVQKTADNKVNNTEYASTEVSPSTEEPSTVRPKRCRRCTMHDTSTTKM